MKVKDKLNRDLKAALLSGEKERATTLRGLKSSILYAEVAANKRDVGLEENEIIAILRKEAKKRQESADLYTRGGNEEKAQAELQEKKIIEAYVPAQLSDEKLATLVDQAIQEMAEVSPQMMGRIIARVKELSHGEADGGRIAAAVKQRLESR